MHWVRRGSAVTAFVAALLLATLLLAVLGGRLRPRPSAWATDYRSQLYLLDTGTGFLYQLRDRAQISATRLPNPSAALSPECAPDPNTNDQWCVLRRDLIGELSIYSPLTQANVHVAKSTHNFRTAWASGSAGLRLVYDLPTPNNTATIHVYNVATGQSRSLLELSAGYNLMPSHNGRWLALTTTDGQLFLIDLTTSDPAADLTPRLPPGTTVKMPNSYASVRWSADDRHLLVNGSDDSGDNLYRLGVPGGPAQPITTFQQMTIYGYATSADNTLAVFLGGRPPSLDVYVVPLHGRTQASPLRQAGELRRLAFAAW